MVESRKYIPYAASMAPSSLELKCMATILIVILILILIGAMPTWPHSRNWGYGPSGGLGTVVVILLILYLLHVI